MNPTQPESFIDRVRAYLPEMPQALHQISDVNQIRVVDTPRVWGLPMTESGVSSAAREAVTGLAAEIQSMLSGAGHTIDIVSLDAPKDQFLTAITDGLKAHAERDTPLLVRLLFGFVPVEGAVEKFVKALAALRKAHLPSKNITMLVGQYYTKQEMWWNHAKIVAVDGKVAIAGGHNLWSDSYGGYPPVHDISLQVAGPAAADAHGFAEFIWTNGGYYLDAWLVTAKGTTNLKNGKERNRLAVPGLEIELDEQPRVVRQRSGGWHRGRVMALGRAGGLNKSTLNASDVAKRVIITSARKSLKICQQDLLFLGAKSIGEHQVCGWIVDALLASDQLEVQIVVSPVDGSGGARSTPGGAARSAPMGRSRSCSRRSASGSRSGWRARWTGWQWRRSASPESSSSPKGGTTTGPRCRSLCTCTGSAPRHHSRTSAGASSHRLRATTPSSTSPTTRSTTSAATTSTRTT